MIQTRSLRSTGTKLVLIDEVNWRLACFPRTMLPTLRQRNTRLQRRSAVRSPTIKLFRTHLGDLAVVSEPPRLGACAVLSGRQNGSCRFDRTNFNGKSPPTMTTAPYSGTITFTDPSRSLRLARGRPMPSVASRASSAGWPPPPAPHREQTDAQSAEFNVVGESMAAGARKAPGERATSVASTQSLMQAPQRHRLRWLFTGARRAPADDTGPNGQTRGALVGRRCSPSHVRILLPGDPWKLLVPATCPPWNPAQCPPFDRTRSGAIRPSDATENNPAALTRRLIHLHGLRMEDE